MSSIASPTTTTRARAILPSSASMRSRDKRCSAVGLMSGEGALVVQSVRGGDSTHPFRLRRTGRVGGVVNEMHDSVGGDVQPPRLPSRVEREAHDALYYPCGNH